MKLVSTLLACACCASSFGVLTQGWERNLSPATATYDSVADVATDTSGNVYVLTTTSNGATDKGDIKVFKYTKSGSLAFGYVVPDWSDGNDAGVRVFSNGSGCIFVGAQYNEARTQGRLVIRSLNSSGVQQWTDSVTLGNGDSVVDSAKTNTGYVVVMARKNTLGKYYASLASWSASGARQWTSSWTRSPFEDVVPHAASARGTRVAVIMQLTNADLTGVAVFSDAGEGIFSNVTTWIEGDAKAVAIDSTGVTTTFAESRTPYPNQGVLAQRFSPSGSLVFSNFYVDLGHANPRTYPVAAIAPVAGQTYGLFNATGTAGQSPTLTRWIGWDPILVKRLGGLSDRSEAIAIDANASRVVVLDSFQPTVQDVPRARVTLFNHAGNQLEQIVEDWADSSKPSAVRFASNGNVYVAGVRNLPSKRLYLRGFANQIGVASITSNPTVVKGGRTIKVKVTLTEPAPSGGKAVQLQSNTSAINTVIQPYTVPAGATFIEREITTDPTATNINGIITATSDGVSKTVAVRVEAPVLVGIGMSFPYPYGDIHVGESGSVYIELDSIAPAGFTVAVGAPPGLGLPSVWTVDPGSTSESMAVTMPRAVSTQTYNLSAYRAGVTKYLTITSKAPKLTSLKLNKEWIEGGDSFNLIMETRGLAHVPYTITLTDTSPFVSLPVTTIPAGHRSVTKTVVTSTATTNASVNITGSRGGTTITAPLGVYKRLVKSISLPSPFKPNTAYTATMVLEVSIPNLKISIGGTGPLQHPSSVTANGTVVTFTVNSSSTGAGNLTAKAFGGVKTYSRPYVVSN